MYYNYNMPFPPMASGCREQMHYYDNNVNIGWEPMQEDRWWYMDMTGSGEVYGPFDSHMMNHWWREGKLPAELRVKNNKSIDFIQLSDLLAQNMTPFAFASREHWSSAPPPGLPPGLCTPNVNHELEDNINAEKLLPPGLLAEAVEEPVVAKRRHSIQIVKNGAKYQNYLKREGKDPPPPPDPSDKTVSKRMWESLMQQWRKTFTTDDDEDDRVQPVARGRQGRHRPLGASDGFSTTRMVGGVPVQPPAQRSY